MNTKHFFISALDMNEQLPFVVRATKSLQESFEEQDRAKKELETFVKLLEKYFGEELSYIGMDVIGEKSYERFMCKGTGFFEIMNETPVAMMAHFPSKARAEKFCTALKKAVNTTLPKGPGKDMFLATIEVQGENDTSLRIEDWHKMQEIRG